MHYRIQQLLLLLLLSFFIGTASATNKNPLEISVSPSVSSDGTARLTWSTSAQASVNIQKSLDESFSESTTVYRGKDNASVITGLMDGEYYFRARSEYPDGGVSAWSETVLLSVEHHSLTKATLFFALGGIVFLATMLLIAFGAKRGDVGN
jgi:hypothetical protein